jgi:hypothetical protein
MAKMLDNAKKKFRNDSQERSRVEKAMSQMKMAPSEQQSMEMAASALAMDSLYKDGSTDRGHVARGLGQEHGGVSEGAGTAMPLPQQVKQGESCH